MVTELRLRSRLARVALSLALSGLFGFVSLPRAAHGADVAAHPFTLRIPGEPETLDWNRAHTAIETYLLMNLMEGLVSVDSALKAKPSLAREWKISKDGKTYTFKLRPGVKWSDGQPLKAADFVYSWKRLLSPVTAAPYAYFLFDVVGAEDFYKGKIKDFNAVGVKALDDQTVEVRLTRPVSYWIYIPSFWVTFPLREDVVSKHGGNAWATPGRMVTVGPFVLASRDLDSKIVLKANPQYHGERGNVDQVTALVVRDDATAVSLFESGKIDFLTDLPPLEMKRLQKLPSFRTFPYLKTVYLGLVVSKYPLNNVRFRRAFAHAIDRVQISKALAGGQTPAGSFVPPPMPSGDPRVGLPFSPDQARVELAASGVDTAQSIAVDLVLPNNDKAMSVGQVIQAQLKKNLGLQVNLQPFDNRTYRAQMDLRQYPVFLASWSADYPDPDNFVSVFQSVSGNNRTNWKSPKYDEAVISARGIQGEAARKKIYFDAQRLLQEQDAAVIPLYYEPNLALVGSRVSGLELNPLNYLYLRKVSVK